jgi:DNA-binding protein HU-beta
LEDNIMNKNELIAAVADSAGLTKAQASDAVDAVLDSITNSLKGGDDVRLLGFGNFVVADRKATTARNPQTGATVDVPAAKVPRFKPGKALKDAVNG